eukprot:3616139-Rhodomonas_salina.1
MSPITRFPRVGNQASLSDLELLRVRRRGWSILPASTDCLRHFPLHTHDQRVHGLYDYNVIKEMRANNQFVTLDEQAQAINKSNVWDPSIADAVLQQTYDAPISVVDAPAENADNAGDHNAGEAAVRSKLTN